MKKSINLQKGILSPISFLLPFLILIKPLDSLGKPNVLWITAEDMSPVLGCYGHPDAITPNIDALAKESVRYSHAFASAPVCSPSRSCLINDPIPVSRHPTDARASLPSYMKGFPLSWRKNGYYATNNVKTDYNSGNHQDIIKSSWDESSGTAHWRKRADLTPKKKPSFGLQPDDFPPKSVHGLALRAQKEVQSKLSPTRSMILPK